jgi:eukaryotic-like serine/threonine-protein kinase
VFGARPLGTLYRVPAAGGTPTPVTSLDAVRAEAVHGFPCFMPDGHHFLYLASSYRRGESSIRLGSLGATDSKVLLGAVTSAIYAPVLAGHPSSLLFVSHGSLMAQPFDARSLELRREPTVLVPNVRYRRWRQASISISSEGILLYAAGINESCRFGWVDRQGVSVASVGPPNDFAADPYTSFNLSPDERRIAIHRHNDPDSVRPTIWMMDLGREGALSRFSDLGHTQPEFSPVWSPDGSEILFSRGDARGMDLLRQTISGGTPRCVLHTEGPKFVTDWSADGSLVAYNSQAPDLRYQHVWIASADTICTGELRPFLDHPYSEGSARFSPTDGVEPPRWIAYTSDETGRLEIYVRDFPGGTHKWQISNQGGLLPQWRRDGRELFYLRPDGAMMAVPVVHGASLEFGPPKRLFDTGLHLHSYDIWMNQYAVAREGDKFLLNLSIDRSPLAITAVIPR